VQSVLDVSSYKVVIVDKELAEIEAEVHDEPRS